MSDVSYVLTEDPRPKLGLVVLQADETIEDDFRQLFDPAHVRLHINRVPSGQSLTPDTIRQMELDLPSAAAGMPKGLCFDTVAYACTSGTALIGAQRVQDLMRSGCMAQHVTNPLTATVAAITHLGLRRVGIVSPYVATVATDLQHSFEAAGVGVADMMSFGEEIEAHVAKIDANSLIAAAKALAARSDIDGVFLSCTNLRTLPVIAPVEAALKMPVLSSNTALAWHMSQLSGAQVTGPGRLLA